MLPLITDLLITDYFSVPRAELALHLSGLLCLIDATWNQSTHQKASR
jgi:hypothetical protein